jgi:hypothetical protein
MSTQAATTDSYAARSIDELPELWDGFARLVRAGLGITAFGAQIMQLPPDYTTESHDETDTGQQELYVALAGAGAVVIGDERLPLDPDHLVRVDAGTGRILTADPTASASYASAPPPAVPTTPGLDYRRVSGTTLRRASPSNAARPSPYQRRCGSAVGPLRDANDQGHLSMNAGLALPRLAKFDSTSRSTAPLRPASRGTQGASCHAKAKVPRSAQARSFVC